MRLLWNMWWIFDGLVLLPLRRRMNAWRPSLTLSLWAHRRGYDRMVRAISLFWRMRNWWRFDIAPHVDQAWYRLTLPLRPKCASCHQALLSLGICWHCSLGNAMRRNRLSELQQGRSRTLER